MVKFKHCVIIAFLVFILGGFSGFFIHKNITDYNNGVNQTNWNNGNQTNYYSNYTDVTNNSNISLSVFNDYTHFMIDPFRIIRLNEELNISLWKRYFNYRIGNYKNYSGPLLGVGINFNFRYFEIKPVLLLGWQFQNIGILGTLDISTNFSISVFVFWRFNLY